VPETLTNVAAHVGRTAVVLLDVTAHAGRVKLAGEVWTARTADPSLVLPAGSTVRVVRIDGATAVVEAAPGAPAD
jgi:membrane protein implicated in regulation of membrane protease activity